MVMPAPGLAIDIDTPADLSLAVARGFCPASSIARTAGVSGL